jgi:cell division protein FtsL
MSIDVEYAIKKDIRNNPVVREVDLQQKQEFRRSVGLAALILGMLLFSAWQHFEVLRGGYAIEKLRQTELEAESSNRRLRLQVESLEAPALIESRARTELHMITPSPKDTLVIERVTPVTPGKAIVARAR